MHDGNPGLEISCVTVTALSGVDDSVDSYDERKASGRCTYYGCPEPAADDCLLCPAHRDEQRARNRSYAAGLRAKRRKNKLCTWCGAPIPSRLLPPGSAKTASCVACRLARGRAARGVDKSVDRHSALLASRTEHVADATDGYARKRFRGGKRGAPSRDESDAFERKIIADAVRRYLDACTYLVSEGSAGMAPSEREAARMAALGQLDLAVRAADEILDRNRYAQRKQAAAEKRERQRDRELRARAREIVKSGR